MTKNKKGTEAVRVLKNISARHGIPEKVCSDDGLAFHSGESASIANHCGYKPPQAVRFFSNPIEELIALYRLQSQF